MNTWIIYCSITGNTEKVAHFMGKKINADVISTDQISDEDIIGRKSIGLASGIYWGRHDKSKDLLFRWFNISEGRPNESDFVDAEKFILKLEHTGIV